jgi:MFS transporter, AAHS family, 4-hydroxybenzoate transporter
MTATVNVNDTIDRHPITAYQIGILVPCMLAAAFDGYDTQAIGYTAPAIAEALHLSRQALGPVFSAALLGAALGDPLFHRRVVRRVAKTHCETG